MNYYNPITIYPLLLLPKFHPTYTNVLIQFLSLVFLNHYALNRIFQERRLTDDAHRYTLEYNLDFHSIYTNLHLLRNTHYHNF